MFALIGGDLINTAEIVHATDASPGRSGLPRSEARMRDGSTRFLGCSVERLADCAGTVIPASAGYQVARACRPFAGEEDQSISITTDAVLAFRIVPGAVVPVFPITLDGSIGHDDTDWVIVAPDGSCYLPGVDQHDDIEAFRRAIERDHRERAAAKGRAA